MSNQVLRGKPLSYLIIAGVLIVAVWTIAYRIIVIEREAILTQSAQQAKRLAEFFEQQCLQNFRYSNAYLQGARREYLKHGGVEAVRQMMIDIPLDRSIVSHITIIDETGKPLLVSGHPIKPGATAKDRGYFTVLKASEGDPIFISLPHRGRNSGKLLLRLVRRITQPDGRFAGVIFAALEVKRITEFFAAMNLGPNSSATLVGTDKRIRARSSYGRLGPGQDISGSRLWRGAYGGESFRRGQYVHHLSEELLVRLGREMLESLGYGVVTTTSSMEALETFSARPQEFDLVITDQMMPTLTGEKLAQALRRIRADIPIILCTGYSHVINVEKSSAMGIDAFCIKPLDLGELARTIEHVLGLHGDAERTVTSSDSA